MDKGITLSIDGEKVKAFKGFKLSTGEILISDADKIGDCEEVRVIMEPSLIKYWVEEFNLLEECGIDATVWSD